MIQFSIKKLFVCSSVLLNILFTSCKNDVVEVNREDAKINILLNNVISPFTAYAHSDMDMYQQNGISSKIVVKAFIYDDSGHLIKKYSREIVDYNESSVTFTTPISGSNPKVVCLTYATFTDSKGNRYDAYKISGDDLLSTFKIEMDYANYMSKIPWQVLGGAIKSIEASYDRTDIEVKPLGSLAYIDWQDIHAHDGESNAPQRYVLMQKYNDVATVTGEKFTFHSSLASNYYYYTDVFPAKNPKFNEIYDVVFMLPGKVEYYCYAGISPSNYSDSNSDEETILKSTSKKYIQVDAGKQYIFSLDCKTFFSQAKEGILDQ